MLSNAGSNFAGLNGAITGGSITVNSSGVSVNLPTYLTTAMASDAGSNFMSTSERGNYFYTSNNTFLTTAANSTHSHGNPTLALTNIFGSTASASDGLTISLSVNPSDGNIAIQGSGTYSQNSGTVQFLNSNGVSFGLSNDGVMTASHNGITTAMASNAESNFVGLNSAITNGSMTVNSSGISINIPAFLTTAMLSNAESNFVGLNSAGTNISMTINSSGVSINIPSYLTTAMSSDAGSGFMSTGERGNYFYTSNNTFLTTAMQSNAGSNFAGLNGAITGGSITVNSSGISVNIPSYLTTAMASDAGSNFMSTSERNNYFYTSNNTFLTTAMASNAGNDFMSTSERGNYFYTSNNTFLTTAAQSGHSHGNPTLNLTNINGSISSTSDGLTLSLSVPAQTAFVLSNSNGMAFGTNGSTVTASYTVPTQSQQPVYFSASNSNTSANTLQFENSNGISWLITNGSLVGTVKTDYQSSGAYLTTAMASDAGSNFMSTSERNNYFYTSNNTFANSTHSHGNPTLALTNLSGATASASNGLTISLSAPAISSMAASGGLTLSTNGSTILFSAHQAPPLQSFYSRDIGDFQPINVIDAGSISFVQFECPFNVTATMARVAGSIGIQTQTNNTVGSCYLSMGFAIYTLNESTLSKASFGSTYTGFSWRSNGNTNYVNGLKEITTPVNLNLTQGVYWAACWISSGTTARSMNFNIYGGGNISSAGVGAIGVVSSNSVHPPMLLQGVLATVASTFPSSVGTVDLLFTGSCQSAANFWFEVRNNNYYS
jgi:hypothetical protein